jgi:hypothetical protein
MHILFIFIVYLLISEKEDESIPEKKRSLRLASSCFNRFILVRALLLSSMSCTIFKISAQLVHAEEVSVVVIEFATWLPIASVVAFLIPFFESTVHCFFSGVKNFLRVDSSDFVTTAICDCCSANVLSFALIFIGDSWTGEEVFIFEISYKESLLLVSHSFVVFFSYSCITLNRSTSFVKNYCLKNLKDK